MIELSERDKNVFIQWVIQEIDERVVPLDEGDSNGLVFNIIHCIKGDNTKFDYKNKEHYAEILEWGLLTTEEYLEQEKWCD